MTPAGMIELTIDGKAVQVPPGTTVFDAARLNGVSIPTLCHLQSQTPVGDLAPFPGLHGVHGDFAPNLSARCGSPHS